MASLNYRGLGPPRNVSGITSFKMRFEARIHARPISAELTPSHPFIQHNIAKHNNRQEPFWWSAICHIKEIGHVKRVVRSHAARKLRVALIESLKMRGYHKDGTLLPGKKHGGKELYGTAQFVPLTSIINIPGVELRKETDLAVATMLQWNNGNRKPVDRPNGYTKEGRRPVFEKRLNTDRRPIYSRERKP